MFALTDMSAGTSEPMRWRKCFVRRFEFTAEYDEGDCRDE